MLLAVRAVATYELTAETFMLLMVEPPWRGPSHRVLDERLFTTPTPSASYVGMSTATRSAT